jgi:hypothetical protein
MSLQNISASFSVSEEERTRKLLENLRVWCDQEHGRRVQIARLAGVTPQAVSNWYRLLDSRRHCVGVTITMQQAIYVTRSPDPTSSAPYVRGDVVRTSPSARSAHDVLEPETRWHRYEYSRLRYITLPFSGANLSLSNARQRLQTSGPYERSPRSPDQLLPVRSHEILESECSFGG